MIKLVACPRCKDRPHPDDDCVLCEQKRFVTPELAAAYTLRFGNKRPKWYTVDTFLIEYNRGARKR